jgi:1,4-dihydroxy-2-naphthoate octaprenyltransferase
VVSLAAYLFNVASDSSLRSRAVLILRSARPWSFVLSGCTVAVGTVLALCASSFHPLRLGLVLVGMVSFHAAIDLINDYFDVKHGVDRPEVGTSRYRPHPLVDGSLQPQQIVRAAVLLYAVGLAIGVGLALMAGWPLLLVATPMGLWWTLPLVANNMRDVETDRRWLRKS